MGITAQGAGASEIREDVSGLWRCRVAGLISPINGIPVVARGGPGAPRW